MYKERFEFGVQHFCVSYGLLIGLFWLVRGTEFLLVANAALLPDHSLPLMVAGLAFDVWFCLFLAAITFPFYIVSYLLIGSFTRYFLLLAFVLFLLVYLGLVQYYTQTSLPLSSDFWGYSLTDIQTTVSASANISVLTYLPFVVVLGLFFAYYKRVQEMMVPNWVLFVFYGLSVVSSVVYVVKTPDASWFPSDRTYTFCVNKMAFFTEKSGALWMERNQTKQVTDTEYPLVHDADTTDVLSPFFSKLTQPPNLVFIIVEGLGGTFVGPDARYGGCTPFLDSLARHSLYWQHTLSTTGRTFGVLSSLFGSLPYSDKGFLETGSAMPTHQTLLRLLKQNGYNTHYFYGGNTNFDKQDVFLEKQQIDYILGEDKFPPTYRKLAANSEGFSWGYSDADVFKRSLELFPADTTHPTLSVYLTLNTHEPFKVPNQEKYKALLHQVASTKGADQQTDYQQFSDELSSLLYTDDAIRELLSNYQKRADYENTIFIITGDHRMIPIPQANRIDRFHVPLLVFSPMLKRSQTFLSVNTHHDVTPTLISFLQHQTAMTFPSKVHWLGGILDTTAGFHSTRSVALMRNKNELIDYIDGDRFLSDHIAYQITPTLDLERLDNDGSAAKTLEAKMSAFKQMNSYVFANNKIYNDSLLMLTQQEFTFTNVEKLTIHFMGVDTLNADQMFVFANKLAMVKQYTKARLVCKWCLVNSPNFIDIRLVLGRTYMWEGNYEAAATQFAESVKRSPLNGEAWRAYIDNEDRFDHYERMVELSDQAFSMIPKKEYSERKKKALEALKKRPKPVL